MARFGQALKPSKPSQHLSKASASRSVLLALPWYLPIGPTSCFYWASKLPHGTFWAGLKTLKTLAAAFEGLSTRSVLLALPWYLPIGPKSCFYWASKLPRGTFWAGLKTLKTLAAAFEGLSISKRPAGFAMVPPYQPHNLYWASKLPSPEPSPEPSRSTWPGSAPKPPRPSLEPSGKLLNLTWLCTKASGNLLRNLLRNPIEPDLALHQGVLEPSPELSPEPC